MARAPRPGHTWAMFGVLWIALLGLLIAALPHRRAPAHPELLWFAIPFALGIIAVFVQWARHPHAVKDWLQGGVVFLGDADPEYVEWTDWAIVLTRRGHADLRTGRVRLARAVLFGLIPVGTVRRSLADFYRVEVQVDDLKPGAQGQAAFAVKYSVFLVDRAGERLCVLDLATNPGKSPGEQLARELRARLQALVQRPGEDVRGDPRP